MAYATQFRAVPVPFVARIRAMFDSYADALAKRDAYYRAVRDLGALSDRELADLGIARHEIHGIAIARAFGT